MVFVLAVGVDSVTHVSPANNSWTGLTNDSIAFIFNYTGINATASCNLIINGTLFGINASTVNVTDTTILANASLGDGAIVWAVNCTNSTTNNALSVNWTLNIDTTNPALSAAYPTNISYATAPVNFNFTYTETNCNKTWYSNDSGATNQTAQACTLNFSSMATVEGSNIWTVYMNDTAGNENSSTIIFVVDTTSPQIVTAYPTNISYATAPTNLNFTYTEINCNKTWYSNDSGATNQTAQACTSNFTAMVTEEGSNIWTVYMNDSVGNENLSIIIFVVDTIAPVVATAYPLNMSYNSTILPTNLNFTYTEINCNKTWYSNDSGATNQTAQACTSNFTAMATVEGTNTWTVYMNDTAGNEHSSTILFVVDTTAPLIAVSAPISAQSYSASTSVALSILITEYNNTDATCWYSVDAGTTNTTMSTSGTNRTFTATTAALANGAQTVYFYCNDSFGHLNNTESVSFTMIVPATGTSSSGASTYTPSFSTMTEGYEVSLRKGFNVRFKVDGDSHLLKVNDVVGSSSASITISSDPVTLTMNVGDSAKLDLDESGYYDLMVYLESIQNSKANFVLTTISEEIVQDEPVQITPAEDAEVVSEVEEPDVVADDDVADVEEGRTMMDYLTWVVVILVVLAILFFVFPKKKTKKKKK